MAQNYPSNDQKVKLDNENQWNALETMRSGFSGSTPPITPTPVEGQRYFNTGDKKWYVYVANGDGTYSWRDESYIGAVSEEVMAARGTLPSLNARLSVLIGANGMPVLPVTQNVNEWADPQITATYVSATEFTCAAGKSPVFPAGIPLLIKSGGTTTITKVVSSQEIAANEEEGLAGYTKVTIADSVLSETETAVIKVAFAFASLPALPLSDAIPQHDTAAGSSGTSTELSRADHTHALNVSASVPLPDSDAGSAGTSNSYARDDHQHPRGPEVKVYTDGETDTTILAATIAGDIIFRKVTVTTNDDAGTGDTTE